MTDQSQIPMKASEAPLGSYSGVYPAHTTPQSVLDERGLENPADYLGESGIFCVTAVLAIPGKQTHLDPQHYNDVAEAGDSLILLPAGKPHRFDLPMESGPFSVRFFVGDSGQVSKVEMRFTAQDFTQAQRAGHTTLMAILSWLSFRHDVGVEVAAWHTYEERTGAMRVSFNALGQRRTLDDGFTLKIEPEYRLPLSAYREGMNSSNVFFQILCFYKVIEWVKKRRAARPGEPRVLPSERMPLTLDGIEELRPEEREEFSRSLGKDFQAVYHRYEMTLRNSIAHMDPRKFKLEADDADDYRKCLRVIPVIRYISRRMLHNELMQDASYRSLSIEI